MGSAKLPAREEQRLAAHGDVAVTATFADDYNKGARTSSDLIGRIYNLIVTHYPAFMNRLPKTCVYLALLLVTACSSMKPAPAVVACPPVEPAACPVCPTIDPQAQQCPEPQVIEKIVTVTVPAPAPAKATTAGELNLPIVGAVEWAKVEPGDVRMQARIDTGAATTSIHAEDIQLVEKDGKRWVHFNLVDPATKESVAVEQRLRRTLVARQASGEEQRRYVVKLWISLGDSRSLVEVILSDRENQEYPLLIGRNLLVDTVIVDVSRNGIAAK
jgi:hypothetical protein